MLRYLAVVLNLLVLWVNAVPKNPLNGAVDDIVDAFTWLSSYSPSSLHVCKPQKLGSIETHVIGAAMQT